MIRLWQAAAEWLVGALTPAKDVMRFLFFNQFLRDKGRDPKAAVLHRGKLIYGNTVDILHEGKVVATLRSGKLDTPTHQVIGWIETPCDVRVR